ncbi:MAG TPA: hypothetical protein VLI46_10745 [Ramlibacter sp.]|nr:hypothetical protein [Ramlibacter sp.]
MGGKPDEQHEDKRRGPSTGQGADSALDALIKRRSPQPSHQTQQSQQPQPGESKKE